MKCPKCQFKNAENAKFCSSCGTPMEGVKPAATPTCLQCGNELRPNAKFCQSCGAAVAEDQAVNVYDDEIYEEAGPRRDMRYIILPLIFLPILFGIIYLLSFRSQNPESQMGSTAAGNPQADMAQMAPIFQTIDSLKVVLETNPADTTALLVLGEMFEVAGKFAEARTYYSRFLEEQPDRDDVKLRVLGTLISEHKHDAEELLLNEILQKKGEHAHTLMHIGDLFDRAGKADKARDFYNRAMKADPQQVDVFMRLAGLHFNEKDYAAAKDMLQKVLDKQPNNPHALYNIALALHLQGDHDAAVSHWQKAVEVDANGDIGMRARQALESFQKIKESN